MNENIQLNFSFKGDRTYVQGPDIFDQIYNSLGLNYNKFSSISFSVHNFLNKSKASLLNVTNHENISKDSLIALFIFDDNQNITNKYALYDDILNDYERPKISYDESIVTNHSIINENNITLSYIKYSFLETIVSMNKFLLSNLFDKIKGKWIFTKISLISCNIDEINNLKISYVSNFKNKIFKSTVFLNSKEIGIIFFNLI